MDSVSTSHSDGRGSEFPAIALAALLVLHTALVVWPFAANSAAVDFFTFWSVPHAKSAVPSADIYSPDAQRAIASRLSSEAQSGAASRTQRRGTALLRELYGDRVDVTGSPLLYALVAGISGDSFEADAPRFMAFSLIALGISVLLLCRVLEFGAVATLLFLAIIASNFSPVISDVTVGNINSLQLLAVSVFVYGWTRNKPALAGAAIGAGAILKPTIALVLLFAAVSVLAGRDTRRAARFAGGVAGSVVVGVGVSAAYFGRLGIWFDFIKSLGRTLGAGAYTIDTGNFSLTSLVFATTGWALGAFLLAGLTLVGVWLLVIRSGEGRASDPRRDAFFAAGWGCGTVLLASPLAWLHYYVLIIPAIFGAVQATSSTGAQPTVWSKMGRMAGVLPIALLSASAETLMGSNRRGEAALVNLAVVITLAILALQMWSEREIGAAPIPSDQGRRAMRSGRRGRQA